MLRGRCPGRWLRTGDPAEGRYLGVPSGSPVTGLSVGVSDEADRQVLGFDATIVLRIEEDGTVRLPDRPAGTPEDIDAVFAEGTELESATADGDVEFAIPLDALGAVGVGDRVSILAIVDEPGADVKAPGESRGAIQVPDISNVEVLFVGPDPVRG